MSYDDKLEFAPEQELSTENEFAPIIPWKILIADDEPEVHTVTKFVLGEVTFEGKPLEFYSAYSGEETRQILQNTPDIAVILLDVVMEDTHTGLELIRYIREVLSNKLIRIILRTGQPGQAPERQVVRDYDINDYKQKSELTSQKLYTVILSSIRSYRDMITIERNKRGLERVIKASSSLFEQKSLQLFAKGVLEQLTSLMQLDTSSIYVTSAGFTATYQSTDFHILIGTGEFEYLSGKKIGDSIPQKIREQLESVIKEKKSKFFENTFIGYFKTESDTENLIYFQKSGPFTKLDKDLIQIFSSNVTIAFDNLHLNQEIINTQKEVIFTLGEVVDTRSKETASHVKRVSEFCRIIASHAGLNEKKIETLKLAAPMHDIGKIGVPDRILNKPGSYTHHDREIMEKHAKIGYEILSSSDREILQVAAVIALQHHERWDGKGYPQGLKGDEISIYARITTIADVFDALSQKRVYKESWSFDEVIKCMKTESGGHFDPQLLDIVVNNPDEFIEIIERTE